MKIRRRHLRMKQIARGSSSCCKVMLSAISSLSCSERCSFLYLFVYFPVFFIWIDMKSVLDDGTVRSERSTVAFIFCTIVHLKKERENRREIQLLTDCRQNFAFLFLFFLLMSFVSDASYFFALLCFDDWNSLLSLDFFLFASIFHYVLLQD